MVWVSVVLEGLFWVVTDVLATLTLKVIFTQIVEAYVTDNRSPSNDYIS